MKIKLLTSISGKDGSFGIGDEIEIKDIEAYRLIEAGLAEPLSVKAYASVKKKIEEGAKRKAEEEAKRKAYIERARIEAELNALYEEIVEKEAELAGVVLDDKQKAQLVEELKNRDVKLETKSSK